MNLISPLWGILFLVLKDNWSPNSCNFFPVDRTFMYDGTNFLERQYISCIFLATIRQDFRHIWQMIMRFEVLQISFDWPFFLSRNYIVSYFAPWAWILLIAVLTRGQFLFLPGHRLSFLYQFAHHSPTVLSRLAEDISVFFGKNCVKSSSCVCWYHVYDSF